MKLFKYIIKRILIISGFFLFLIIPNKIISQNYFKVSNGIKYAYHTIINLQLDKAQNIIDSLKIAEPKNMFVYHIENYIDFYKVFINEDYEEFINLEKNKDFRIKKIESGDKNSPYYRFSIAEIKLQWAISRLKFNESAKAAFEVRSAYKSLQKNQKEFPEFAANYKSLSVIHAITGTLTRFNKSIFTTITGIDGTIKQGVAEIAKVIDYSKYNEFLFKEESYTIAAFIAFHLENDKKKAWRIITAANLDITNSPLACFVLANIAEKTGKNEYAINILKNRPPDTKDMRFYYLDYMSGRSLLYKNEKSAKFYLERFVNNFKGINYIKDAYLKLAWYELIVNKNKNAYLDNIKKCISEGKAIVDEDKTALKIAKSTINPNIILLKARLLYDGAYYGKAYAYLVKNEDKTGDLFIDKLEFNYRMGRILQALNSNIEAIIYFKKAEELGNNTNSHFVCNSFLQHGIIYEKLHKYNKAKIYFTKCLEIDADKYKNSTHQKAKAGLLRIENK